MDRTHRTYHAAVMVVALAMTYLIAVPETRASHLAVSATFFATALVTWAFIERRTVYTEYFAPAMRVCTGNTCPEKEPELPDVLDAYTAAQIPLRSCDMYFTDNINECDADLYKKSKLELIDLRSKYEAAPGTYAEQLAEVNRVLADYDTVYQRQCKLTFNDWVRPMDPSYPFLRVNAAEVAARGNPRHWAHCFVPIPDAGTEDRFNALINKNTSANGQTIFITEGDEYELLNGTHRRVEFGTMTKRDLVRSFCTVFTPMLMPALRPFYLNLARKNLLYAIDMTNDGIIQDVLLVRWDNGYLRVMPKSNMVEVESYQDDVSQRPNYMGMDQTPERFSLESAYHCSPPRLRVRNSVYHEQLKRLFMNEVINGNLVYTLQQNAQMFLFNINICQRVDKIDTKNIVDLMAFFGNALPASSMLRAGESRVYDELLQAKDDAHRAVCDLASQMTVTYNDRVENTRKQKMLARSYIDYSQPDTGAQVRMEPHTAATSNDFRKLRDEENKLVNKFKKQTNDKLAHIANIDRLNMALASIEQRMHNTVTALQTATKGKRIAVKEKPYTYISNDGRVYFQMM